MANGYEMPTMFGSSGLPGPPEGASAPDRVAVPTVDGPVTALPAADGPAASAPPVAAAAVAAPPAAGVSPSMRFMESLGEGGGDEAHIEAALSDLPSFRHADAEGSLEAVNGVPTALAEDRRRLRARVGAAVAVIVAFALAGLLVDPQGGFFAPGEAMACYDLAFQQLVASLVAPSDLLSHGEILAAHEAYFRVLDAALATVAAGLGGMAACVGGLLLQSSFRRAFAVAPIAGVSAAVLAGQGIALLVSGSVLGASWAGLLVACLAGLVPALALRFRFNGLNLPDADARQLGVDAVRLRRLADACAVVLLVASQVQLGPVFPIAVALPPLARALFGVEFRCALSGSALIGAAAMLFAHMIPIPLWVSSCGLAAAALLIEACASGRASSSRSSRRGPRPSTARPGARHDG